MQTLLVDKQIKSFVLRMPCLAILCLMPMKTCFAVCIYVQIGIVAWRLMRDQNGEVDRCPIGFVLGSLTDHSALEKVLQALLRQANESGVSETGVIQALSQALCSSNLLQNTPLRQVFDAMPWP